MTRLSKNRSLEELKEHQAAIHRKYDRSSKGHETYVRNHIHHASSKKFIAWDGEGIDSGTSHRYILLANSEGDYLPALHYKAGIPTHVALNYLTQASLVYPDYIHVGFSLGYDINMMLRDISRPALERLYSHGRLYWNNYSLEYRPRKYLEIKRYPLEHFIHGTGIKYESRIMLWDVFAFFQSSFVKALKLFFKPEELETLGIATIVSGKEKRSSFTSDEFLSVIVPYCQLECKALVALMNRLYNEYCLSAGIVLRRFDGVGAIAESLLSRYKIKQYYGHGNMLPPRSKAAKQFNVLHTGSTGYIPDEVMQASQYAYGGGRIEAMMYGHYIGPVHYDDINSAYPSEMVTFPDLSHGVWVYGKGEPPELYDYTLYKVYWKFANTQPFYPFFYRSWPGDVTFPQYGANWIWSPEVKVAVTWLHKYSGSISIKEYWRFIPSNNRKPYDFIYDLYERRRQLKAEGNGMQLVYKLGYNSFYGKTVQHLGYEDHAEKGDHDWRPPFYQLQYGGMTTSGTRAKLFDAAMQHPESVLAFATDGMWSLQEHSIPTGDKLGEWEYELLDDMTIVQSGVYWYSSNGKTTAHFRGFDPDTLTRESVLDAWSKNLDTLPVTSTRFVTLGQAMQLHDFSIWHTWNTSIRELSLYPKGNGKRLLIDRNSNPAYSLIPTSASHLKVNGFSEPFPLPWNKERKQLNEYFSRYDTEFDEE